MTRSEIEQIVDFLFTWSDQSVVKKIALLDINDRVLGGWARDPLIRSLIRKFSDEETQE